MSMIIRHPLEGEPLLVPLDVSVSPDRFARLRWPSGAIAWAKRLVGGSRPARERAGRSLFHAMAASDLADRDVARQIWRGVAPR